VAVAELLVAREDDAGVATLWLDRPDRRNALSGALVSALLAALEAIEADPSIHAVVLTGRGTAFCAGGDLADGLAGQTFAQGHEVRGQFAALMERIPGLRVPVVAAVNGDALGGGCGLVAACDLAIADPSARFGTPEIKLGLFPWIILAAMQRNVPRKALMELVLTGEKVTAERAQALGLVNRVSTAGDALAEARALAASLARRPPWAMAAGKAAFYRIEDLSYRDGVALAHGQLSLNLLTEDAREGVAAFQQKREPAWKGQ
jgi:enoyl-CoA hydratase/carnithine racemase